MTGPVWHWASCITTHAMGHADFMEMARAVSPRPRALLRHLVAGYPLAWVIA